MKHSCLFEAQRRNEKRGFSGENKYHENTKEKSEDRGQKSDIQVYPYKSDF